MATRTVVHLVDDIDGSEAEEEIRFALDGVSYEIDLNAGHAQELRDSLAKWIDAGRRTGGRSVRGARTQTAAAASTGRRSRGTSVPVDENTAIREWARGQKISVKDRGRIPTSVVEQYHAAHGG